MRIREVPGLLLELEKTAQAMKALKDRYTPKKSKRNPYTNARLRR